METVSASQQMGHTTCSPGWSPAQKSFEKTSTFASQKSWRPAKNIYTCSFWSCREIMSSSEGHEEARGKKDYRNIPHWLG